MKPPRAPRSGAPSAAVSGHVRIIGGRWRGSKLPVTDLAGLRPSADRVRETLFNWLMPHLPGAVVLDAFAGSGALGLEAVSRGAARAVLVERDSQAVRALQASAARLDTDGQVRVIADDVLRWLATAHAESFDLVFLDPPFAASAWDHALAALAPRLAPGAWVYLESPVTLEPAVPQGWVLHREGRTRDVRYALYRASAGQGADTLRDDSNEPASA
ncbi:16S rRNA (guanine(966)-N(2))-methyltransferase RsmD [Pseudoxanthomonas indica]|uniref:Ribosomal RNA small subunit methyltransferase D n=1 Tax=Pseudoxanthomonas indica TaxID=428993 RepID=A0A1T5JAU6_9GAMM|nr:16S rRNA (guanine(966)-N(2))-methyltransferase RsmD [Pseudoxanthomonas indica]SKC48541.1 16S rRNA m(2)G-966 methyltransferase [Pseudoxanthomonas indica]